MKDFTKCAICKNRTELGGCEVTACTFHPYKSETTNYTATECKQSDAVKEFGIEEDVYRGGSGVSDYQERMKEWAEAQDWHLIQKVFRIDSYNKEYSIEINGIGFAVSDFHNFEKEFIDLIAKYRI